MFVSFLLQLINYLTCSTMFLVPNIDQMYKEMMKIQTVKRLLLKSETNFQILLIFFFWYKKCWGPSVDRKHTYLFGGPYHEIIFLKCFTGFLKWRHKMMLTLLLTGDIMQNAILIQYWKVVCLVSCIRIIFNAWKSTIPVSTKIWFWQELT